MEEDPQNSVPTRTENTGKMNPKMAAGAVLVVLALVALGYFITKGKGTQSQNIQTEDQQTVQQDSMSQPNSAIEEQSSAEAMTATTPTITIEGGAFYFKPNQIKVKKGDKVAIEFKNSDGNHDFTIDEFNVKTKTISSGETAKVEFTASKTGSFEFYCSIGNHRQMGMKGTLLVVE